MPDGNQAPTSLVAPPAAGPGLGEQSIALAELAGVHLDPWQGDWVRGATARRANGLLAAKTAALSVTRQSGKTAPLATVFLSGLFLQGCREQIWTAHQVKTSADTFSFMADLINDCSELKAELKTIRRANGQESIVLKDGRLIRFIARSKASGRGFSPERVAFDEAQHLSEDALAAVMPSLSSWPNAQALFAGTAPAKDDPDGDAWQRLRWRAMNEPDDLTLWVGWLLNDLLDGDVDPLTLVDDPAVIERLNPSLGIRHTLENFKVERSTMSAESFLAERLNFWPAWDPNASGGNRLISIAAYGSAVERGTVRAATGDVGGRVVLAVEQHPESGVASIVAVTVESEPLIETVQTGPGLGWVPDRVAELVAAHDVDAVVWDGAGPVRAITAELIDQCSGLERVVKTGEVTDAAMRLVRAFDEGRIAVAAGPEMMDAAANATARKIGEGWAFERRAKVSVAAIVAASLGLLVVETASVGDPMSQILV